MPYNIGVNHKNGTNPSQTTCIHFCK